MKVIMDISEERAEIDIKDFEGDAFCKMVPLAVRVFADACFSAGASAEDVKDVVMDAVQGALEISQDRKQE